MAATGRVKIGPAGGPLPTPDTHTGALWALLGVELAALVLLRRYFRRHHGG